MGSLVELKKELEQVDEDLAEQVSRLVDYEDDVSRARKGVEVLQKHKNKLTRAIDILEDRVQVVEDKPRDSSPQDQQHKPSPPEVPSLPEPTVLRPPGRACSACGDKMYRAARTMQGGITVDYWQCGNRGCNNEQY